MKTKSTLHEGNFVAATSRRARIAATFRLQVAIEERQRREIGARIRQLRADGRYGQQAIADFCGVRLRAYQQWQAGDTVPSPEHLERLAEFFGVSAKYILRGDTPDLARAPEKRQLDRIEQQVDAIYDLLTSGETKVVADVIARLIEAASSHPPPADAQSRIPRAAMRRKTA